MKSMLMVVFWGEKRMFGVGCSMVFEYELELKVKQKVRDISLLSIYIGVPIKLIILSYVQSLLLHLPQQLLNPNLPLPFPSSCLPQPPLYL